MGASQLNISGAKNVNAKMELVLEQRCLVFHAQELVITLIGSRTHTVMMVTTIVVVIGTVEIAIVMMEIMCAVVTGTMVIAVETIMFTINALIVHARTRMQWSILPLVKTLKS